MAARLQQEMRRTGAGLKVTVNQALRRALSAPPRRLRRPTFTLRAHDFGFRAGTGLDRMNQLYDELEAATDVAKLTP